MRVKHTPKGEPSQEKKEEEKRLRERWRKEGKTKEGKWRKWRKKNKKNSMERRKRKNEGRQQRLEFVGVAQQKEPAAYGKRGKEWKGRTRRMLEGRRKGWSLEMMETWMFLIHPVMRSFGMVSPASELVPNSEEKWRVANRRRR